MARGRCLTFEEKFFFVLNRLLSFFFPALPARAHTPK
jgi:hypothetical protein